MRDLFKSWMEETGLSVRIVDFGNMYGRREGKRDLAPVLIGSHLDTQPRGGRFDGILGVLTALEVVRTLTAMIFLPSVNGKSHDVSELTSDKDIEKGANVLFGVIKRLANDGMKL